MARPANTTHVVFVGHLAGGEIFNTGFWLAGIAPANDAEAATLAGQIATNFNASALKTALKELLTPDSGYDSIRVYGYPAVSGPAAGIGQAAIPAGTGSNVAGNALQLCMVATLLSASASRSGRGRMYLPAIATIVIVDHLFTNVVTSLIANQLALWLGGLEAITGGLVPIVMSPTHGLASPILSVRVDNKPDIQRRRADKEAALFTQVALL